jgi:hypothetical protein
MGACLIAAGIDSVAPLRRVRTIRIPVLAIVGDALGKCQDTEVVYDDRGPLLPENGCVGERGRSGAARR